MSGIAVLHDTGLRMALDYAGVAVFAATGALAAARRGYDIVTFAFFAAITGIGGGTLRDLLIGAPVFWVGDPGYVGVCIFMAAIVWMVGERLERFRPLLWLDALGLAAYCVVGASKAAAWGEPPLVAAVMGVLTATFGGIVRDVLAGEPSVLLRKELYVTPAVAGAGAYVLALWAGGGATPDGLAAALGVLVAFGLRAGAVTHGWTLPGYRRNDTAPDAMRLAAPALITPPAEPAPTAQLTAEPSAAVEPPEPPKPPRPTSAAKRAALSKTVKTPRPSPEVAAVSAEPKPVSTPRKPRVAKPEPAVVEDVPPPAKPRRPRAAKPKSA